MNEHHPDKIKSARSRFTQLDQLSSHGLTNTSFWRYHMDDREISPLHSDRVVTQKVI
jgi:hypothetical protein